MIKLLVLSCLAGLLYYWGGEGPKWIRRFGIPPLLFFVLPFHWTLIPSAFFLYGALTTYHDYLASDYSSENWLCWLMTGFCYGLALFPYAWGMDLWVGFWIRCVVLALLTMAWSEFWGDVRIESGGRGFLICITLLFLTFFQ